MWISPRTWAGTASAIHPHVLAAIFLGGLISIPPALLAILRPGRSSTRYTISAAQALTSALLIHLTGGRIETHFHVFGSLAFLSFYRDWKALVPATIVVAADHFLRGMYFPESVYGLAGGVEWRWLEHAWWVIFEDVFLIGACIRSTREMWDIAERTAETTRQNAELAAARAAADDARATAEAASNAKSLFLAHMSHEIRTPLNGVIGLNHLLIGTELTGEQSRYVQLARTSADALLSVINDILDFSKIEAGKLEIQRIDFDLCSVIEDPIRILSHKAAERKNKLALIVDPGIPPQLRGDPDRLRQILINLLNNAVKFTEAGTVTLRVSAVTQSAMGIVLRFAVNDTGIGIPPDRMDRLFKSFSQGDSSTTRQYGGTGLGLAICRQLVELMGGQIGVESEPKKGSTFWFNVPLTAPAPEQVKAGGPSGSARNPPAMTLTPRARILLVEDNQVNQTIVGEYMRRFGYHCEAAENGKRGVEAAAGGTFDLVLMDCQMPVMDGFEATAQIRRAETSRGLRRGGGRLPILALTANASDADRDRCLAAGMDGYLPKPFDPDTLIRTIESLLRPSAPAPAAAVSRPAAEPAKVDYQKALERCMGDRALLSAACVQFKAQAVEDLAVIQGGSGAGDAEAVARASHRLKGSASYLAIEPVRAIAAELEDLAAAGDIATAGQAVALLQQQVEYCLDLLTQANRPAANSEPSVVGSE